MKKLMSIIFLLFVCAATFAVDISFTWRLNPVNEMVTTYVIEYARPGTINSNFIPVITITTGTNFATVRNLPLGTYKFRLIAKNGIGSSLPSEEILIPTNAPTAPLEFRQVP